MVRNYAKRPLSALFTFLLVIGSPAAGEPNTIIPEWNASIQLISTSNFNEWPGISGISPVDVSAVNERTWLVWPGSVINLNDDGKIDEQTLLTLFASQTADWGGRNWTAEHGVICSDGFWRGFILEGESLARMNLQNGEVIRSAWGKAIPDSIYPAVDGNLLVLTGSAAGLVESSYSPLDSKLWPISQLAVSTQHPLAAWKDAVDDKLHISDFSGGQRIFSIDKSGLPGQSAWSLAWAGEKLVMAYPGELFAVTLLDDGTSKLEKISDKRLPGRWYRLRGGENRLIVQSPETGMLGIIRAGGTDFPESAGAEIGAEEEDFPALLEYFALSAGNFLEGEGELKSAEKFYGWILPYIREYRSRRPLEEIWPELESELATRRLNLRSRLN